jgi:GWxTD domain-containing protein
MVYRHFPKWMLLSLLACGLSTAALAQTSDTQAAPDSKSPAQSETKISVDAKPIAAKGDTKSAQDVDPLKRPISPEKAKKQRKALLKELEPTYKHWLNEDVVYIITDEERNAFLALSNDEERDQFIEAFWLRRDPTPDTVENEYKDEHYRRIAYANEHFAAGIPGWKTDRGRMYITFGPPDEIDSHPTGGYYQRTPEEGGGSTSTYPFEDWRYRYIEGIGQEVEIEFVDQCGCGAYQMEVDRSKKDALLNVPGAGLTTYEEMGLASKAQRFNGFEQLGAGPFNQNEGSKIFDRLDQYAKLQRPPAVKFKDLEEVVTHKIRYNTMPFEVRADFVKVTSDTALVPFTVQLKNRDITFVNKDGVQRGVVNIFGRVTTITGRIAQTFEDTVSVEQPAELLPKVLDNPAVYWKAVPLKSGRYRVDIVVKDVNGDRVGTWSRGILVPDYSDDKLASSTLILADQMEKVPNRSVGTGNFVIGQTKVRPRVEPADGKPAAFKRKERVNLWMQVYNLGLDKKTNKPDATVEYDVVNAATNKPVVHAIETTQQMGNVGDQLTLEKSLPLSSLEPGLYRVSIKVSDNISKQQPLVQKANFAVE